MTLIDLLGFIYTSLIYFIFYILREIYPAGRSSF